MGIEIVKTVIHIRDDDSPVDKKKEESLLGKKERPNYTGQAVLENGE